MLDIQAAVYNMLDRIQAAVNQRGIFNIARVQPCGSMAEKTSIWKYLWGKPFIELDFLAILENSTDHYCDQGEQMSCPGCSKLVKSPVNLTPLNECHNSDVVFIPDQRNERKMVSELFLNEINFCLAALCGCMSVSCRREEDSFRYIHTIAFKPTSTENEHRCDKCTVDMPSGTLRVNTSLFVDKRSTGPSNCSLIFLWISKENRLSAPDRLLVQEPQPVATLPVFVDFLPALESVKSKATGKGCTHESLIVPKGCNLCKTYHGWRKSSCMAEMNTFLYEMTENHRGCYQIIKYLLEIVTVRFIYAINKYHLKTAILNHRKTCPNTKVTTGNRVECVIKVIQELHHAYESETLNQHQTDVNIIKQQEWLCDAKLLCQRILDNTILLTDKDT